MATPRTGPLGVFTAKGDLPSFNGTDVARLPVGATDGHALVVDAAEALGLKYAQVAGGNVNVTTQFISDCLAAYTSVTVVAIGEGVCRDDGNTADIVVTAARSANITLTGAGGRNVETAEQSDKWYAIYIIADTTLVTPTEAAFLVNEDDILTFALPGTYNVKRRVGWVRNDASGNLRGFKMVGTGRQRQVTYHGVDRDDLNVFTDLEPTTWTAASCAEFVPPTSIMCDLDTIGDMGANDYGEWRPTGSTLADGQGRWIQTWDTTHGTVSLPGFILSDAQSLDYRRNDTSGDGLSLYIYTYRDDL